MATIELYNVEPAEKLPEEPAWQKDVQIFLPWWLSQ